MGNTIDYYNVNADQFIEHTIDVDFSDTQERFLKFLKPGDYILDFGCGSGRDTKYFLNKGFKVDAIDGSFEMCKKASVYTGIDVRHMFFSELDAIEKYYGIWACASILHLPKDELTDVIGKMIRATKKSGYLYMSFKYGEFEGIRNGRYFTDFNEEGFSDFILKFDSLRIVDTWVTSDVRPGRSEEKWLNIILQKSESV